MTQGDVLQLLGLVVLSVGLFVLFGVGWMLAPVGGVLLVAGELVDWRRGT